MISKPLFRLGDSLAAYDHCAIHIMPYLNDSPLIVDMRHPQRPVRNNARDRANSFSYVNTFDESSSLFDAIVEAIGGTYGSPY